MTNTFDRKQLRPDQRLIKMWISKSHHRWILFHVKILPNDCFNDEVSNGFPYKSGVDSLSFHIVP